MSAPAATPAPAGAAAAAAQSADADSASLLAEGAQYACWEEEPLFRTQVAEWVRTNDLASLAAHFRPRIAFGTAGLRAMMGPGYHNINCLVVTQTSQAFARYIESQALLGIDGGRDSEAGKAALERVHESGLVLGYDGRHRSRRFAECCAAAFLAAGFRVALFSRMVATPFVPFGVLQLKAAAGVVITASHNPKDDNGYKVYWANGAQIIPPHDAGISGEIGKNLEPWHLKGAAPGGGGGEEGSKPVPFDPNHPRLSDPYTAVTDAYYAQAAAEYCWRREANLALPRTPAVTYTAMHGVGAPFTARAFAAFDLPAFIPTPAQIDADPEFPTVRFPNPEEGKGALALAMAAADAAGSTLILANDPDADRLAVAEKLSAEQGGWTPLNGNQIALLLADWTFRNYVSRERPSKDQLKKTCMVASTVSSNILGAMAEREGFNFYATLTGFKWMGNRASQAVREGERFLFAFEVEIGFLVGPQSFDKDGVRTAAIFYELWADLQSRGVTLHQHLQALYERYGFFAMQTSYFFCSPASGKLAAIFARLRAFPGAPLGKTGVAYPTSAGGVAITSVRDVTLGTDTSLPGGRSDLPRDPSAHMITFRFENGCTATLRNSGTEPKLKYYVECRATQKEQAEAMTKRMTEAIIKEFIQPEENGLEAPKQDAVPTPAAAAAPASTATSSSFRRPGFTPIIPCLDIDASERFYNALGFTRPPGGYDDYRILTDGREAWIHLRPCEAGWVEAARNPFGVYLYTPDVDAVAERARAGGIRIVEKGQRAEHKPWKMYELSLSDPNGTLVRVGWPSDLIKQNAKA